MPYPGWQPTAGCLANITKMGGRICDQPVTHCWDTSDYTHKVCECMDPFLGNCTSSPPPTPPRCCPYTADSPIPSYDQRGMCYCCCSCFAYDTPIAYSGTGSNLEFRPVQEFAIGDDVLVADARLQWRPMKLQYSSGAPAKSSMLIKIDYMLDGKPASLLVTRGQLFLRPDGTLVRGEKLMPQDALVLAAGGSTPVLAIAAGIYDKGVHHIATSATPATSVDGHLLNSNGVVTGDYALQISDITRADTSVVMAPGHNALPSFGTEAYRAKAATVAGAAPHAAVAAAAHAGLSAATARAVNHVAALAQAGASPHPHPEGFLAMAGYTPSYPAGTQSYFTDDQAWDIQRSPERAPVGSGIGSDVAKYLMRLFGGMYPTIIFEFNERDDVPNAYAFEFFNERYVILTGGLVRVNALTIYGIAAIVAHCVARLQNLAPRNQDGYSCRSIADYATPSVVGTVFWGNLYANVIDAALKELHELYALVSAPNAAAVAGDTCMRPALACRLSTMQASIQGMPLPECAGGPKDATLTVTGATAALNAHGEAEVTIGFSAAVDPQTVTAVANYQFDPPAVVTGAAAGGSDPKTVVVRAQIAQGKAASVFVVNVTSADGHPLIRSQSDAEVTWPSAPPSSSTASP